MKAFIASFGLFVAVEAFVARRSACCFTISASNGTTSPGGQLGQLSDGQNRVGPGLTPATYCIDSNGGITDSNGRGCILTAPTTQFQCDTGAAPQSGFSIGSDGLTSHNGSNTFQACPTGEDNQYNIYSMTPPNYRGCSQITLSASSCSASSASSSAPSTSAAAPTTSACPASLSGNYEFPHLIVPVDSASPNTAYGTQYDGNVTSTVSTILDFDIPPSDQGKTCTFVFLLPQKDQLTTSSYSLTGSGAVEFLALNGPATTSTTYGNVPDVLQDYGPTTLAPGNSYTIGSFPCPGGQTIGFEMKNGGNTCFNWFQDYNSPGIGAYITVC